MISTAASDPAECAELAALERALRGLPDPESPWTDRAALAGALETLAFDDFERVWPAAMVECARAGKVAALALAAAAVRGVYRRRHAQHTRSTSARRVEAGASKVRIALASGAAIVALHELVRNREERSRLADALEQFHDVIVVRRDRRGVFVTLA